MIEESGINYFSAEKPFFEYFNRCGDIGMTKKDIKKNLFLLDKYYKEMVLPKLDLSSIDRFQPSVVKLLNKWERYYFSNK